jgi:PST family polysaccharide transporter
VTVGADEPLAGTLPEVDAPRRHELSLRGFVASAGLLSLSSLANVVRGLVTAKVLAVTLGPSPLGILAQLLNFATFLMTVVPLGLTTGVSRMIAMDQDSEAEVSTTVGTATAIAFASGLVAALAVAPFAGLLSGVLTGSPGYSPYVLLLLATLPLSNLAGVLGYVLQGMADVRRLTWVNVSVAAATLVVTVPAAFAFGLPGVVGAICASSVFHAGAYLLALRSAYRARGWRLSSLRFAWDRAVLLLGYGGILLAGGIATFGSVVLVRTLAVHELGAFQNGIYQVAYALSTQYMAVFMAWMSVYVFPRITAEPDRGRIGRLLNFGLTANLYLVVPVLVGVIALREAVINVLFSPAFQPMAWLLPVQVFGDYLKVLGWSFGIVLFARGHTRAHLVAVLAQAVAWVAVAVPLLRPLGLAAVVVGYAISYLTWPLLMYPMARHWFDVRVSGEAAALAALGVLLLVGATVLPWLAGVALALVLPAILAYKKRSLLLQLLGG